jgi:hypothetical protein
MLVHDVPEAFHKWHSNEVSIVTHRSIKGDRQSLSLPRIEPDPAFNDIIPHKHLLSSR